jgi:hypothetical protein
MHAGVRTLQSSKYKFFLNYYARLQGTSVRQTTHRRRTDGRRGLGDELTKGNCRNSALAQWFRILARELRNVIPPD